MDAFIDTVRRRSPIRESMPVHVRPTLFLRMMWVSTDIDYVVGPSDKYITGHRHPGHRSERRPHDCSTRTWTHEKDSTRALRGVCNDRRQDHRRCSVTARTLDIS